MALAWNLQNSDSLEHWVHSTISESAIHMSDQSIEMNVDTLPWNA